MFGECRELEEMCGVTDKLLKGEVRWGRSLKEEIRPESGLCTAAGQM